MKTFASGSGASSPCDRGPCFKSARSKARWGDVLAQPREHLRVVLGKTLDPCFPRESNDIATHFATIDVTEGTHGLKARTVQSIVDLANILPRAFHISNTQRSFADYGYYPFDVLRQYEYVSCWCVSCQICDVGQLPLVKILRHSKEIK